MSFLLRPGEPSRIVHQHLELTHGPESLIENLWFGMKHLLQ